MYSANDAFGRNRNFKSDTSKLGWVMQEANHSLNNSANREIDALLTCEEQKWKSFNNFEKNDHKATKKQMLKDEITNIAMRIVKAREAQENLSFCEETGKLHGTWKVGEVEMMNKGFGE